ncbi:MAG: hypothetical protein ABSC23_05495 [Bryobacteraceae bacterium]|jgi:hypothetical protein
MLKVSLTGADGGEALNLVASCPPEFVVRLAILKQDELLLAHIAACERCSTLYEMALGIPAPDRKPSFAVTALEPDRLHAPRKGVRQALPSLLHARF